MANVSAGVPLVSAHHLQKSIGSQQVLRDVSFTLGAGAVLAIMGGNGAGKTTLLRIVSGFWSASGGQLERFGQRVGCGGAGDARVGMLGHHSFLYPHLTAYENLVFYARLWGLDRPSWRADDALARVGLSWCRADRVRTFSRGMLQRAALARMLVGDPVLLLLDEPYSGMDLQGHALVDDVINDLKHHNKSVLLVSHQPQDILRVADGAAILHGGIFTWWAPVNGLAAEQLARVYAQHTAQRGMGNAQVLVDPA